MTNSRIQQLESEIANIRREEQKQAQAEQLEQLRTVTCELEKIEDLFTQQKQLIQQTDALLLAFNREIVNQQAVVGASLSVRPEAALYLTPQESKEVANWTRAHEQHEAKLAELVQQRNSLPVLDRVATVQLGERIQYLRQVKINLLNSLGGSLTKIEGGIYSVR
ncbi:hypothetical protein [Occallatibacter savannae]|uniref:hypothetical protein n=1 Tax=Occallatibacter savannae TaxID=1002691 RepID=UPI000D69DB6C|nr:hypothetical protein [Occallatibacter savannae]